jgi:exodeoxyribonuclease VII small subunit
MKKTNELTYEAAKAELEAIVNNLRQGNADIDKLAADVKRAAELLSYCQDRLRHVEEQVMAGFDE